MPRFITKKNICNCWVSLTLTHDRLEIFFQYFFSILAQKIANALANGVNWVKIILSTKKKMNISNGRKLTKKSNL